MVTPYHISMQQKILALLRPHVVFFREPAVLADSFDSVSSSSDQTGDHPPELRVRQYTFRDAPRIFRLRGSLRLDLPDSLVNESPRLIDLLAAMPFLRRGRPTFIATADGQPVGYVRFSPRRPDGRWVVTEIASSTGVFSPEPVWELMLGYGVRAAGLRGVRRLFARVPAGHALAETMRLNSWVPYASETIFRAERMTPLTRPTHKLRLQEPADMWSVHQLYASSVPRQIQEIEALTSHVWYMERPRRMKRGVRTTVWLLDDEEGIKGYARYTRDAKGGLIDVMVPAGAGRELGALLDGVISRHRQGQSQPIYCALRTYHADLRNELIDRGFSEIGEQDLLIRYTTATARTPIFDPVHFPVELRPAMPRRVPTFLEGQPTDGMS